MTKQINFSSGHFKSVVHLNTPVTQKKHLLEEIASKLARSEIIVAGLITRKEFYSAPSSSNETKI